MVAGTTAAGAWAGGRTSPARAWPWAEPVEPHRNIVATDDAKISRERYRRMERAVAGNMCNPRKPDWNGQARDVPAFIPRPEDRFDTIARTAPTMLPVRVAFV